MKRCLPFLLLSSAACSGFGQSTNATISGGVTDPSGNLIPNADVAIQNDSTGVVYTSKTNQVGMYLVPILPPGQYHVQVSKQGFKTIIKADVTLNVQSAVALNFVLPVGATSESVTVDAASSAIPSTDASVSTLVDRKFVENTPLNGRSFQDLISLTPGVVTQTPQNASTTTIGGSGDFSVNGQRTQSNYYTVDGVSANITGNGTGIAGAASGGSLGSGTALGTTQSLLSVDALQEFRVQSSSYSAEYGRTAGGQFSLVTRSGTDVLHGSAYDYLRNNYFDANDWFNNHYGVAATALRQNDFGGTVGGPIRIPHLYEGRSRSFFFVSYEGLRLSKPTAAAIQYVPNAAMRQQAVSAMRPILNAYPIANGKDYGSTTTAGLAEFISPYSLPSTIDSTSVRLDHSVNQRLAFFFRYGYTPSVTGSRPYFARFITTSNLANYTTGMTVQISSRMSNEVRVGYSRSDSSQSGNIDNYGGGTPVDLAAAMGAGSYSQVLPVISISVSGIGSSLLATYDAFNKSRQWNVVDSTSLLLGSHSLKWGIDFRQLKSLIAPTPIEPYAVFTSATQLLTGAPATPYVFHYSHATPIFRQFGAYLQDEWQAASRLHLSYGLRWEVNPPPTEQHGDDAFTLLGDINVPASLSVAPRGTPLWHTAWYNFAPRAGISWTAHDTPGMRTVFNAGGGVFFDSVNDVATLGYSGLGFRSYTIYTGATLPYSAAQLSTPVNTNAPYTTATIIAFPNHLQLPYTLQWNASLHQGMGKKQTLSITYVAANGRRLVGLQQASLTKLNPNFGSVQYFKTGVTSNYQSLQLQFQRTVTTGVHALASYTWSHALDYGSNSNALPLKHGNSDYDVRHNFQAGISWEIPGPHDRAWLNPLVHGWGIDSRLNIRTAFPISLGGSTITDPTTGSQYAGGLNYNPNAPLYVYGSVYPGNRAINKAAFSLPTTGTSGNAPRNFVRGFGANQWNMAVRRDFPLHQGLVLHFRAETFNLLNHPNFGYVDPGYTNATFGQATRMLNASLSTMASQYQQGGARSMQFALRLSF